MMPLVPYITAREGEEAAFADFCLRIGHDSRSRVGYRDETPSDLGPRGELWGRCSQSIGPDRMPVGRPLWSMVHPSRQRECMMKLRCQICVGPAKAADGYLFLESGVPGPPSPGSARLTAHPPVCLPHARASAEQCGHFAKHGLVALMVRSAPLYGVIGTPYQLSARGWRAMPADDTPVPYSDPAVSTVVASQLVRSLRDYTVVRLDELE